ncbi:uncharacterized protein At4g04775-like [Eutrema salsugineum]|uniref:uncharacterized protein At4g04775-like n=1 Tax=Eutrema salsugineum TaxID=72664 RepID=UPI000CECF146|nr:uncharacterized protein At4g04775-like [Eutrema salsugineum]
MPSYSSGSSEYEDPWACRYARADANYGILEKCFCGRRLIIEESTVTATFGRRFYTCPEILGEENDEHIWKWWDEAVSEQLSIVKSRIEEQREMMQRLFRVDIPTVSQTEMESRMAHMRMIMEGNGDDISEIKLLILDMQRETDWLKQIITNRCSDIVLLALFLVFAAMTLLFK